MRYILKSVLSWAEVYVRYNWQPYNQGIKSRQHLKKPPSNHTFQNVQKCHFSHQTTSSHSLKCQKMSDIEHRPNTASGPSHHPPLTPSAKLPTSTPRTAFEQLSNVYEKPTLLPPLIPLKQRMGGPIARCRKERLIA